MARRPKTTLTKTVDGAKGAIAAVRAPSPNPMTNLIITDIALRGGGRLIREAVERTLLGATHGKGKAKKVVSGRSLTESLVATLVARMATKSVPGAIVVGGGLLAKSLYDRRKGPQAAKAEGEKAIAARVKKAPAE